MVEQVTPEMSRTEYESSAIGYQIAHQAESVSATGIKCESEEHGKWRTKDSGRISVSSNCFHDPDKENT